MTIYFKTARSVFKNIWYRYWYCVLITIKFANKQYFLCFINKKIKCCSTTNNYDDLLHEGGLGKGQGHDGCCLSIQEHHLDKIFYILLYAQILGEPRQTYSRG